MIGLKMRKKKNAGLKSKNFLTTFAFNFILVSKYAQNILRAERFFYVSHEV